MDYCIENEFLHVCITSRGAQIKSLVRKSDRVEHIWCGDERIWGGRTPILFPYTGRIKDGRVVIRGKTVENAPIHGVMRNAEFRLVEQSAEHVVLHTQENADSLAVFPYRFRFSCEWELKGERLCQHVTVFNTDTERFSFGLGFHPGFAVPFDENHRFDDYELRFSEPQSPLCVQTPQGFVNGQFYSLGTKITAIPVTETLFDEGSHCMVNLTAASLGLYEKGSGRGITCSIRDFPFCLIWSPAGQPKFVCIEPWHSLPDREDSAHLWEQKSAAATLAPNAAWSTTLEITTVR